MELNISKIASAFKTAEKELSHASVPCDISKTGGLIDGIWHETVKNGFVSEHVAINSYIRDIREISRHGTIRGTRGKPEIVESLKNQINMIDEQFKGLHGLNKDKVFYRGIQIDKDWPATHSKKFGFDILTSTPIGEKVMPDYGYAYASESKAVAEQFGGKSLFESVENLIMEINTPKGSKVSYINAHGGEGLFPRMSEFILKSRTKNEKGYHVVMDYIKPEVSEKSLLDKIA